MYRGQPVLNGLFGVEKSTELADGTRWALRLIMNLIPTNSILQPLVGRVQDLPGMAQYLSIVLEDGQTLRLAQSDMTSAFYLFGMPSGWSRYMAFNVVEDGDGVGLTPGIKYALACRVLPMGWASAVSVMQELSEHLLLDYGIPRERQVTRTRPLPSWLTPMKMMMTSSGCYRLISDW